MRISDQLVIDESELQEQFVRASGPGGQNVNKVSTAVQLRFNAAASRALSPAVRDRLLKLAGGRATAAGEIVIIAQRFRSQPQNRTDARARLAELIARACLAPKFRRPTKPTAGSKRRRLDAKQRTGIIKQLRSRKIESD
jgi:ribosome-associated protein